MLFTSLEFYKDVVYIKISSIDSKGQLKGQLYWRAF